MKYRLHPLRHGDVRTFGDPQGKLKSFKTLLNILVQKQVPILESKNISFGVPLYQLEAFYWRAQDTPLFKPSGEKLRCKPIYHMGIHYLLGQKYGFPLKGYPLFVLLCEAMASMAEFYFFLESFREYGQKSFHKDLLQRLKPSATDILESERKANKYIRDLVDNHVLDPHKAYKESVLEMYRLYEYLFKTAMDRINGKETGIPEVYAMARKLKFGPLCYSFAMGNNILYALANAGPYSSPKDKALVKDCLSLHARSRDFSEFVSLLS